MYKIELTKKEKTKLEMQHHVSKDGHERDRIKAVLLHEEGWTLQMIAQALRIHETTIHQHLKDYGNGKLQKESGGSDSLLSEKQTQALIQHLENHTYQSTHEIINYVKKEFEIIYSIPCMNKWLHRNKFSYKKPKGTPHKANKAAQEEFIKKYEQLKASVGPEEPIVFMDSVHPSQATKIAYGWIKKGQDKPIETSASRTRMNITGAIELGNLKKTVFADYETINGETVIDFLKKLRKKYKKSKQIHLILDGAGYHKSDPVVKIAKKLKIHLGVKQK